MGAKIRAAEISKVPVMLIIGAKEEESSTVSVRRRFVGDSGSVDLDDFVASVSSEISSRDLLRRDDDV